VSELGALTTSTTDATGDVALVSFTLGQLPGNALSSRRRGHSDSHRGYKARFDRMYSTSAASYGYSEEMNTYV
jgi:hypothetical protein